MSLRIMRVSCLLVLALSLVGVAQADPIFISIDPTQTYLHTAPTDTGGTAPLFYLLSILGVGPGDSLFVTTSGGLCFHAGTPSMCSVTDLGVVFTSDTTLLGASSLNRLSAIGPPAGITSVVSPATWDSGLTDPTDITQDFAAPNGSWLSVVIPNSAVYLAVGVIDSKYMDNGVWEDHALELGLDTVPEPATLVLLASGFGLLCAFRRLRRAK